MVKRPHFVPRTYIRAWADLDGQVAYRRRGDNAIPNGVRNVAVIGGFYGQGELGEAREKMYQDIEGEWPVLRRDLIENGDLHGDQRSLFSLFAGLQLMRTPKHAELTNFVSKVAATTADRPVPQDAVRDYLRDVDDGAEPDESEVEAAWSLVCGQISMFGEPTDTMNHSVAVDVAVRKIAPGLETLNWTVHKFRGAPLISSDSPVHSWRGPTQDPGPRGVGIGNADEVRFPLSPGALLIMEREPRRNSGPQWSGRNPRSINAEIARQCHQFIFGTPGSRAVIDRLPLLDRPPRLRFRMLDEDAIHMYVE